MDKNLLRKLPLVQQYFSAKESKLVMDILKDDYWEFPSDDLLRHHFIIYLDLPKPIILLKMRGSSSLKNRTQNFPDMKEMLLHSLQLDFDNILFLLTYYSSISETPPDLLIKKAKSFTSTPLLDEILKPSHGLLLYAHQFEQIYERVKNDFEIDAIEVRKGWNKKKPEIIAMTHSIELKPGFSFYDMLKERTIESNHFVWNVNFKGAKLLWDYLNKLENNSSKA